VEVPLSRGGNPGSSDASGSRYRLGRTTQEATIGLGDNIMASGLARDALKDRGVRVAFGERGQVIWDKNSEQIFRNNPNIVFPGNEGRGNVQWIPFYKGKRGYNRQGDGQWIWNLEWKCVPGQIFLSSSELEHAKRVGSNFVVIEPNVPMWKSSAVNKHWPLERYQAVSDQLIKSGFQVSQMFPDAKAGPRLQGVRQIRTPTFRDAVAALKRSSLYIGPEGGMHHAAAAVGVPAVVLFGGFIPPSVTGYDTHTNLVGSDHFCGSFNACKHCADAMNSIKAETVIKAAKERL